MAVDDGCGFVVVCACVVLGDLLFVGVFGMRLVAGGLALLAGICGGLSPPAELAC